MFLISLSSFASRPGQPPPPPANPVIAYNSNGDLMVMDADGANQRTVLRAAGPAVQVAPSWTPEGDQLIYSGSISGRGIYSINLDGTDNKLLLTAASTPNVSPGSVLGTGPKIVFAYPGDAKFVDPRADLNSTALYDLYIMNLDGTGLAKLTDTPDIDEHAPCWSPGGSSLAALVVAGQAVYHLYVLDLDLDDNGEIVVVGRTDINELAQNADVTYPTKYSILRWANSQDKIAVKVTFGEMYVIDLAAPFNMVQLTKEGQFSGGVPLTPCWSPDDSQIAFSVVCSSGPGKKLSGIYVMNSDGTGVKRLASGECRFPRWYRGAPE
jgi:Tol biopolymer transport system component